MRGAVEREVETISEASRRVPKKLKATEPGIAGIGNVLRHDYEIVSDPVVWNVSRGTCRLSRLLFAASWRASTPMTDEQFGSSANTAAVVWPRQFPAAFHSRGARLLRIRCRVRRCMLRRRAVSDTLRLHCSKTRWVLPAHPVGRHGEKGV